MKETGSNQDEKLREAACFGDTHAVRVLLKVIQASVSLDKAVDKVPKMLLT